MLIKQENLMPITGNLLIDNQWQPGESGSMFAVNPANGETLPTTFTKATAGQVTLATRAAGAAFDGRPLTLSLSRWVPVGERGPYRLVPIQPLRRK
jgi:hypothetical protein